jgi:serine/threonine protein kinase/formylglycine-generating enzyme required for sulfatase activity/dienelactone hydrolase
LGIKCPKCQSTNPETATFCADCGTKLISLQPEKEIHLSRTRTIQQPLKIMAQGYMLAGKYRIMEPIGKGGMGVVYKAEDTKLKRTVAVKFLPSELSDDSEAGERFLREAQAAAALSHPHICTIHEINEEERQPFIVMEYVEGQSLNQKIKRGPLEQTEALEIAIQVAEGLEEAHKKGIIHRDIKSGNIMLTAKGQAKVMDFGLAKVLGESLITKEAKTMGTVAYMSPEQAQGKVVDSRTDIWSLGVVLYEMLTAELPFKGERETSVLYSIVHEEPRSFKGLRPPIPSELQQIIIRAMKKAPQSRYRSASEMLGDLRKYEDALKAEAVGMFSLRTLSKRLRQPRVAVPGVFAVIAIAFLSVWFFNRQANIRWARDTALPEIKHLIDSGWINYGEAYTLAQKAGKYIPRNSDLQKSLARCGMNISVMTEPPGANIFIKKYRAPESDWSFLGITPIEDVRVPFGFFRWKFEKEGYEPAAAVFSTFDWEMGKSNLTGPAKIFKLLDEKGTVPPEMVRVSSGDAGDFFMDEHEVTNREFKEFIDRGGYQKKDYWKYPFVRDGKTLTWEKAMAEFLDAAGMPGPSTWEGGNYPEGRDDYPVSGVSWYEAAAYAEFVGKSLPTISQWEMGAGLDIPIMFSSGFFLPFLASMSKFGGDGPALVGSHHGLTAYGAFDMAGNVREWCRDEAEKGRCLRGGAWNDVTYMFLMVSQAPPFDRSAKNGFRCILSVEPDKISETIYQPIKYKELRDFYKEEPVPDAIFQVYKEQFSYDRTEIETRLEARDETQRDWIKEKISFKAAYENERMMIYLFLPRNAPSPYQGVIVFPGSQGVYLGSSEKIEESEYFGFFDFIIRSGRALIYPIYKGTYERGNPSVYIPMHLGNSTRQYSDFIIKTVKDFKRTIDYLETRDDIDIHKLAFYGHSTGAIYGAIIPAVEERLKVSVLNAGGLPNRNFRPDKARAEVDEINYVTRVKIPTLMLNGMYDYHAFPLEISATPMFDLLGTSKEDKLQRIYDSDHTLPRSEYIRDTLHWLDRYLGPGKR